LNETTTSKVKIQQFFLYSKQILLKLNIYSNFTFMNTIYANN